MSSPAAPEPERARRARCASRARSWPADRPLPAPDLTGAAAALQVRADVLALRGGRDPRVRRRPRPGAGGLAAAALQPVQLRRIRSGGGPASLQVEARLRALVRSGISGSHAAFVSARQSQPPKIAETLEHAILANVIQDAFSPLISLFEGIMVFIHDHLVGGSWGLAIVGLTVLIRAVLVPLTYRQLKSMQEMQRLAPQIAALKEIPPGKTSSWRKFRAPTIPCTWPSAARAANLLSPLRRCSTIAPASAPRAGPRKVKCSWAR